MATTPKTKTANLMTENSTADVLNAMRNSYPELAEYTPVVTDFESYKEFGKALTTYEPAMNRFIDAVNRIVEVIVNAKLYSNPWAFLKKGIFEYGDTIEELFVNIAKPHDYDVNVAENEVFKRELPDVRSAFYHINYEKFYKQTIQDNDIKRAFLSMDGVQNLIAGIVNAMYSAAQYDEYVAMKYLVARVLLNSDLGIIEVQPITDDISMKENIKKIRATANGLTFLSQNYNESGVYTSSDRDDLYMMIDTDFEAIMGVDVLATAFNMSETDYPARRILIDGFSKFDMERMNLLFGNYKEYEPFTDEEIQKLASVNAILFDREWFRIYDNLNQFTENYNGEGLYWNYFFHNWKTFFTSPFANAVAFVSVPTTIEGVTVSPSEVTTSVGQVVDLTVKVNGSGFPSQKVTFTSSDKTVATVSESGKVHANNTGSATITVTSKADPTKTATVTVTVS